MNFLDQGIPNAKNLKREGKRLELEPLAAVSRRRSEMPELVLRKLSRRRKKRMRDGILCIAYCVPLWG